ncbi:MAG TPA: hypothetical protein VHL31_25735 [Geminicoccus sp.]|nr:hypothetical protein [Geminicoccus sp.]HEX2529679.1 hypothetical protein [Geminicoccus sp.]
MTLRSDTLVFACWNGKIVQDLMIACVKRRIGAIRTPHGLYPI